MCEAKNPGNRPGDRRIVPAESRSEGAVARCAGSGSTREPSAALVGDGGVDGLVGQVPGSRARLPRGADKEEAEESCGEEISSPVVL